MTMNRLLSVCGLLATAAPAAVARDAGERPRVVLLAIEGDEDGAIRNELAGALGEGHDVLGPDEWNRAAARLGLDAEFSKKGVAAVAPELRARAVVGGSLRKGARWTLLVVVRDGASGDQIDTERVVSPSSKLAPAQARQIGRFAVRTSARGKAGEPTLPPEPAAGTAVAAAATPASAPIERRPGESAVEVTAGLTTTRRSFDPEIGRPYSPPDLGVGGLIVGVEAFPLVLATPGALRNLGASLSYGQVFTMSSKDAVNDKAYDSTQRRVTAQLRYRLLLADNALDLRLGLGLDHLAFKIDDGDDDATQMPDVSYSLARVGATANYHLPGSPASIVVDGAALVSGGSGFAFAAGGDWRMGDRVRAGGRLDYTRVTASHEVASDDVDATDSYLTIMVLAGLDY
jgi:hypothetical protein